MDPLAIFALADLKAYLSIASGTDDGVLTTIGNGVSAYIERRTNILWKTRPYTITRDGDGRKLLLRLPRPIVSVTSLTENGAALTEGVDFVVYPAAGKIARIACGFACGLQNIVVALTAGYDTVPYDIVEAGLELAKSAYDELKTGAVSLSSISLGSVNAVLKPGLNPRIEKFLDAQRDVRG